MKRFLKTAAGFLACVLLAAACAAGYDAAMRKSVAEKLTRLQVVAHSDADGDQRVKLAVRDRVLEIASRATAGCTDPDDARRRLAAALPEIERAAGETVYAAGRAYPARVSLGKTAYPFRDYGTFALPGGEYTALRVVLGDGAGHNWWCVMYPPLCVQVDGVTGEYFTDGEQDILYNPENYEIRFKCVEIFNEIFSE